MGELRGGSTIGGYPIETTKGSQSKVDAHAGDTTKHITAAERTAWNAKAGTAVATTSANGLMTAADKTKLDGIATGANNYTLPTATASVLGGVKTGTNITNSSGTISVPNASTSVKGAVQLYNALTSTATDLALTAAQGKVLNDRVTSIESGVITIAAGSDVKRYIKIAEMASSASIGSGLSNLTLMLTGVGNFGSPKPGSVLAHLSNRGGIGGQVYVINDNNINVNPIQYVNNTTTGKIDVYYVDAGTYEYHTTIRVLSNIGGNTVKIFSTVATAPAGLTPYPSFNKFETQAGAQTRVDTHANNSTAHITATERTTWNAKAGTAVATTSANGLMAAADKIKLDGIATGANNYTLPTATGSVLGGVKTGTNITNSSGTISVPNASTSAKGVVQLHNALTSTATDLALTAAQGKVLNDKTGDLTALKTQAKGSLVLALNEVFQSASDGKALLSTAITGKGVQTAATATYSQMSDNIKAIKTGVELQGLMKSYKAANGVTLKAGDFVDLLGGNHISTGTTRLFESTGMINPSAIALNDNKVMIVYEDANNKYYGTALVLSVSGTELVMGTPYVFKSSYIQQASISALTETKVALCFCDGSNNYYPTSMILTVSGTNITGGTQTTFGTSSANSMALTALSSTKVIACYSASNSGNSVVLTVSGSYLTKGTNVKIGSGSVSGVVVKAVSEGTALVFYRDSDDNYYGKVTQLSITGTSITDDSTVTIGTSYTAEINLVVLSDTKAVVCYNDNSNYKGMARVLTLTSSGISVGASKTFGTADISYLSTTALSEDSILVSFGSGTSRVGTAVVLSISGTTITVGNASTYSASGVTHTATVALSRDKVLTFYSKSNNNYLGYVTSLHLYGAADVHKPVKVGKFTNFIDGKATSIRTVPLSDNRVLICYLDSYEYIRAVVATLGDSGVTFGSFKTVVTTTSSDFQVTPISDSSFLLAYYNKDSGNYGTAIVITVSNTTVSAGSAKVFSSSSTSMISVSSLTDSKVLVAYTDVGNGSYGSANILTISNTTISVGTPVVFVESAVSGCSIARLSDNDVVICYSAVRNSSRLTAITLTVNGATITANTPLTIGTASSSNITVVPLSNSDVMVCYNENSAAGKVNLLKIAGNTITNHSSGTFSSSAISSVALAALTNQRVIICYRGADFKGNIGLITISDSGALRVTNVTKIKATIEPSDMDIMPLSSNRALLSYSDTKKTRFGYTGFVKVESPDAVVREVTSDGIQIVVPW